MQTEEEFLNSPPTPLPNAEQPEPAKEHEQPAPEGEPEKPKAEDEPKPKAEGEDKGRKETPWFQRRIDELTRQRHDEARRAEALQTELDRLKRAQTPQEGPPQPETPKGYTEADIERLADQRAAQREFDRTCNTVYDEGLKAYPDFGEALGNFRLLGGLPPALVEAAVETGSAAKVLYELGNNPNEAARILQMSPTRMAVAVAKLASQPVPTPQAPPVSKAPAPIKPIANGSGRAGPKAIEDMTMAEYAEYEATRAAKRNA